MKIPSLKKRNKKHSYVAPAYRDWPILLITFVLILVAASSFHVIRFVDFLEQEETVLESEDVEENVFKEAAIIYEGLERGYIDTKENPPLIPPPTR